LSGNRWVWRFYHEVVRLSQVDGFGLPTLSALEFILGVRDYGLTELEFEVMIMKVLEIHQAHREYTWQKIKPKPASN